MKYVGIPPLSDYNAWADLWYYEIGVNVIPADTKKKKTYTKWLQWQRQSLPADQFEEWKRTDTFKDGLAIIVGEVWRGPRKGCYLIFLDLDNKKAIEEFCTRHGETKSLKDIAEKFIVEQHADDPSKCHIFFYSEIPLEKKSSDITDAKIPPENVPAIEIKGKGTHGIAYVAPSFHKNGHQYRIIGTSNPVLLNPSQAHGLIDHLDEICRRYDLKYLKDSMNIGSSSSNNTDAKIGNEKNSEISSSDSNSSSITAFSSTEDLFQDGAVIWEGHNRHLAVLKAAESLIRKFHKDFSEEEIRGMAWKWNQKHCRPPLSEKEFEAQWQDAKDFIFRQIREEEAKKKQEQQQRKASGTCSSTNTSSNSNGGNGKGDREEDNDEDVNEGTEDRTARAKKALELARTHSEDLFLNEFGRAFAAMKMPDGHVEVHPMDETKFKNWISGIYYRYYEQLLSEDDLNKIVRILTARAEHDSSIPRHRLDVRVRGYNKNNYDVNGNDGGAVGNVGYVGIYSELMEDFDAIYCDLTNKKWEAIKITPEGWEIDSHPPYLFRRFGGEVPQVYPDRNYEPNILDQFFDLWNLKPEYKEMQKILLKSKIVTDLWPNTTPKPIIILPSAQGTGKTTSFELNKDLIDPNSALTMSFPKDDNQLKQALAHNYMAFFDNLSWITDEQSNTLCRAVTGAGDMKRKLFEDDEDIIYNYRRIVGINGITNVATRSDLMERGLIVLFGDISREQRELLRIIRRKHLKLKAKVLAFCLDVVSEIIAERKKWKDIDEDYFGLKDVIDKNGGLPRMADWAILGEQAAAIIARKEGRSYDQGTFLKAFDENLKILNVEALKASLAAEALIAFMTDRKARGIKTTWEGSPTMLLAELNTFIVYNRESIRINTDSKAWPQNPSILGKEIAQIAPNLRALGIFIEVDRTESNVLYKITILPTVPTFPNGSDQDRSKDVGNVRNVRKSPNLGDDVVFGLVNRAMSDGNGGRKGYFTEDDWAVTCLLWPNLGLTIEQSKQLLNQLLQDEKVTAQAHQPHLSSGRRYQPTKKFSNNTGVPV